MACALYWVGRLTGIYHNPYSWFLHPSNISLESLRILISFSSKMEMRSSSHSWPKEIIDLLWTPSKTCAFVACFYRLVDNDICTIWVADMLDCGSIWCISYINDKYNIFSAPVVVWCTAVLFFDDSCFIRWVFGRAT